MGIITKLTLQKKGGRANLFIDDKFYSGVSSDVICLLGLKEGIEIDDKKLNEVVFESETRRAFDKSLEFLSSRPHTAKEIKDKLYLKEFNGQVIYRTIEKLEEYGYLNDNIFTKEFVNIYSKNKSPKEIQFKLMKKGISKNYSQNYIEEISDECVECTCKKLCDKYLKNKDINIENIRKLKNYLFGKGFDYDIINKIVSKYLDEE